MVSELFGLTLKFCNVNFLYQVMWFPYTWVWCNYTPMKKCFLYIQARWVPLFLKQGGFVNQRMNAFIPEQDSWFEQLIKNNTCKSILVPEGRMSLYSDKVICIPGVNNALSLGQVILVPKWRSKWTLYCAQEEKFHRDPFCQGWRMSFFLEKVILYSR